MNSYNAAPDWEHVKNRYCASATWLPHACLGVTQTPLHLTLDFFLSWKAEKILNSLSHTKAAHSYS